MKNDNKFHLVQDFSFVIDFKRHGLLKVAFK